MNFILNCCWWCFCEKYFISDFGWWGNLQLGDFWFCGVQEVGCDYHGFRNCFTKQVVKLLVCAKDGVHLKWCFDGECEEDWAKVDTKENPSFNTPPCLQVFRFHLGNLSEERKGLWVLGICRDSQVKRGRELVLLFRVLFGF